jgi:hypothetical protein
MRVLKQQRLPVLRQLAEGKSIPKRIQKAFLLDYLADFYYNRNHDSIACELTEILYQCFSRNDPPSCPIDFDCELNVQQTMMECVVWSIQNLPQTDTQVDYCRYTCDLVDRYEHDVRIANEILQYRYSAYLDILRDSAERVKYYIRKRMDEMEPSEEFIEDIAYTDADTDADEESESWKIEPVLLVSPPKVLNHNGQCPICLETQPKKQMVLTNCQHSFCHPCFSEFLENAQGESRPVCPLCRTLIYQVATPMREVYADYSEDDPSRCV